MSLKAAFSRIRNIKAINYPIRKIIRSFGVASSKVYDKLNGRWPVSGVVNCKYEDIDFKLFNKCDDGQVQYFYYNKAFHELPILKLMCAFAKRSRVILDIGANTGIHSVIVSRKNPGTKIYAIEPYESNFKRLEKNLSINDAGNVVVKKIALGEKEDTIVFNVPVNDSITDVSSAVDDHGARIYEDQIAWKKIEVKQSTLSLLADEIGKIDFFKCDVESYEVNLFKGATDFFARNRPPFILEITLSDEKVEFFNEFAKRYNYTIYFVADQGLVKLDQLYVFDRWPNFLFAQYKTDHNYVPFKDIEEFADKAIATTIEAS